MPKKTIDSCLARMTGNAVENRIFKKPAFNQSKTTMQTKSPRIFYLRFVVCLIVVLLPNFIGCGSNRFQQELTVEQAAVKLTRETIAGDYPLITTKELKELLDGGEEVLLVDTMPGPTSYAKGHVSGAVNFTFPKVVIEQWSQESMGEKTIEEFEAFLGSDKSRKVVFYCGYVKCPRSHNGAVFAKQLGYTNIYRYPGGIDAWRGAGFKLTTK